MGCCPFLKEPRTHLGTIAGIGAYEGMTPMSYETYYPETPFHAGSTGWSQAPVPGWGENTILSGPRRLAIRGLGSAVEFGRSYGPQYVGVNGLAADTVPTPSPETKPTITLGQAALTLGAMAAVFLVLSRMDS